MHEEFTPTARRRSGVVLVYVAIVMVAMMAFTSLAVDLGRYEVAHSQLYDAALAASRAGALSMSQSGSTAAGVTTAATTVATGNTVDGQPITSGMVAVTFVNWNSSTRTGTAVLTSNYSQANAVSVSITYTVPTVFAQVLGLTGKAATEYSTTEYIQSIDNPYVIATGNPWLAGEPTGTTASQPDPNWKASPVNPEHRYKYDIAGPVGKNTNGGTATQSTYASYEPYSSPVQVSFTVTPGSTITLTNASGASYIDYDNTWSDNADGTSGTSQLWCQDDAKSNGVSEHGIADVTAPTGSIIGVFLGSGLPDSISSPPTPLSFSTQTAMDYISMSPLLQQPFYFGNGQTSGGTQQQIVVPANATRLFMGILDGWEWNNNAGGFNCTVTQTSIVTVQ